ncbi:MAG: serine/threonine protein kinase, partial [Planctomycetes bacterium]|nr:serine/threonine protein kinase [Planctomycetota bacterium]
VHRDVKPANVLVTRGEKPPTCKLADFGLARVYQASTMSGITMLGDTGGTLPYMPPEQITHYREASPAADQYSAAATLYRFLTGRHLFDVQGLSNADRLVKILFDPPVPIQTRRPDVPDALAQAIHRAIEKKPADRFPNAASFRQALLPFARHG